MSVIGALNRSSSGEALERGVKMTTVELGGVLYDVFIVVEDEHGVAQPTSFESQAMLKAEDYFKAILQTHEARAIKESLSRSPIATVNASGVQKADNSHTDHNFAIEPYAPEIAADMAPKISSSEHPLDKAAIKTQDLWNAFEKTLLTASSLQQTLSSAITTPDSTLPDHTTSSSDPTTAPHDAQKSDTQPPLSPTSPSPKQTLPTQPERATPPTTAAKINLFTERSLGTLDTSRPGWYESIPNHMRLHAYRNIARGHLGPIEQQVHKRLIEQLAIRGNPYTAEVILEHCIAELKKRCAQKIKPEHTEIYAKSEEIFKIHTKKPLIKHRLVEKMDAFPKDSFLLQYIQEQAVLDGETADISDPDWAASHCLENVDRFIQALQHWASDILFSHGLKNL